NFFRGHPVRAPVLFWSLDSRPFALNSAANYAALPGCFAGWIEAFPAVILICLGLDSSRLAMLILSTPSLNSAFTLSGLTVLGRVKERTNFPYWRSIR